jgi:Transposase
VNGTGHSEEQIIAILKQGEAGLATAGLCRQQGISEQMYYRWKAKYGGMESGDAKKLKGCAGNCIHDGTRHADCRPRCPSKSGLWSTNRYK